MWSTRLLLAINHRLVFARQKLSMNVCSKFVKVESGCSTIHTSSATIETNGTVQRYLWKLVDEHHWQYQ
jgi:hypothetical protein